MKLVLEPLGSICEFLDGVDPDNPNNYAHQLARSWQGGDSFSRGKMVGNATSQVALIVTPVLAKNLPTFSAGLSEARVVEAGTIAEETLSSGANTVGKTGVAASVEAPKADFYVKPNGELVPSTGYRYMDSSKATEALRNGKQYTTYFGVDKFDSAADAQSAFQVSSSWSDCRIRGEFDTLQVIDEVYIPTTLGNTTDILEPIATSYPEFGRGGAQQFRVDKIVEFSEVKKIGE